MKRLLTLFGAITLVGTSTTSLVACNTPQEYTKKELTKLKAENKINIIDETIKYNLEWIAPQEKPFNNVDNKYYFVVWRGDKNDNLRLIKFKNYDLQHNKILDKHNECVLVLEFLSSHYTDLFIQENKFPNRRWYWKNDNGTYIKSIYRWNLDTQDPELILDENGNIKVNGE
ncbi:putative lipoprotein [Spiroplasma kunkelii CR2-3x]|uniref:Putative lipoprotein n=1 Tax=Spiroplasma kunkelii CR2-3x TaxID=273035 RepID=A0A0K2JFJ2_SPIKU|nr:lipoprotein [Spiroplasma kunkelii]ALA97016.1 putative lipoprotein [Spiroplasma kunkelii CR2-3x]